MAAKSLIRSIVNLSAVILLLTFSSFSAHARNDKCIAECVNLDDCNNGCKQIGYLGGYCTSNGECCCA